MNLKQNCYHSINDNVLRFIQYSIFVSFFAAADLNKLAIGEGEAKILETKEEKKFAEKFFDNLESIFRLM